MLRYVLTWATLLVLAACAKEGIGGSDDGGARDSDGGGGPCVPSRSCASLSAACGVIDDGCGSLLSCGSCSLPAVCGAVDTGECGCRPLACAEMDADCGELDDGCGGVARCGVCSGADTCGGGGVPNVCGRPVCEDGFCFENPRPEVDDLGTVFVDAEGGIWAGGADGVVLAGTGGSFGHAAAFTRIPSDLEGLVVLSDTDGWAVGENGAVLYYDGDWFHCSYLDEQENSNYWSPVKWDLHAVVAAAPDAVWAVGDEGILSFDGASWRVAQTTADPLLALLRTPTGELYAAGRQGRDADAEPLLLCSDGSAFSPEDIGLLALRGEIGALVLDGAGDLVAVGRKTGADGATEGGLAIRRRGGIWQELGDAGPDALLAAATDGEGRTWIAGEQGSVLVLAEGTLHRAPRIFGACGVTALHAAGDAAFAVGPHGLIAELDGAFWRLSRAELPFAADEDAAVLWQRAPNDLFAGGDGWLLHWNGTRFGATFVDAAVVGFFGTAHDAVWIAGNRGGSGIVLRYDGVRIAKEAMVDGVAVTGMGGTSSTDVRAFLADGSVLRYDGLAWRTYAADAFPPPITGVSWPPSTWELSEDEGFIRDGGDPTPIWPFFGLDQPRDAWAASAEDVFAAGADGIIRFDGAAWRRIGDAEDVRRIAGRTEDDVWLAGTAKSGGPLWRFDGTEVTAQPFDHGDEEELFDVSITEAGDLWAAGARLYRRGSGGFEVANEGDGEPFVAVHAFSGDDVWAATPHTISHFDGAKWTALPVASLIDRPPLLTTSEVLINGIFGMSPDEVAFIGKTADRAAAILLVYQDGEWGNHLLESYGGEVTFTSAFGSSAEDLYVALGEVGWIYHYKHSIRFFDYVLAPCAEPLLALTGTAEGDLFAFGAAGVVLRSE